MGFNYSLIKGFELIKISTTIFNYISFVLSTKPKLAKLTFISSTLLS